MTNSAPINLILLAGNKLCFDLRQSPTIPAPLIELSTALKHGSANALLYLANHPELRHQSDSIQFWHSFAQIFMRHVAQSADSDPFVVSPISDSQLNSLIEHRPATVGSENIQPDALLQLWGESTHEFLDRLRRAGQSPRDYLHQHHPLWADVGRIHFHLAENRKDPDRPFAFLATYSVRTADKARTQHRPLGLALKDSLEKQNQTQLLMLLKPIQLAASSSEFLRTILESREIYQPLYLSADRAYEFLEQAEICEASGIICKLPDFWKGLQPQAPVLNIKIGARSQSLVGVGGIVDFTPELTLGDQKISPQQLDELLNSKSRLIIFNNRWVKADRRRIEKLKDQWQQANEISRQGGVSFGHALRLMAGLPPTSSNAEAMRELYSKRSNCHFELSEELSKLLNLLRNPHPQLEPDLSRLLDQNLKANLREYQKSGVNWLRTLAQIQIGGCLADDMGLGKTIQIISLLILIKSQRPQSPNLLVVPASLIGNWQNELRRFAPSIDFEILHPKVYDDASQRADLSSRPKSLPADLYITTYGMLSRLGWILDIDWHCAIIDEAQAIKNASTKTSRNVRKIKAAVRFAMTGTPVENNLADLWSIFDFCCPGLLGNIQGFRTLVSDLQSEDPPDYTPLRKLIAPYLLRRRKTDKTVISDLPDKIEMQEYCDLSLKQVKLYSDQVKYLAKKIAEADGIARKGLILSTLSRLKQICNHPSQLSADNQYLPSDSGKFLKLRELIEVISSRNEKLLIFTQFREITDILHHLAQEIYQRPGLILHGGTDVSDRQSLVDQFQRPDGPPFFVLSLKAGGTGLNLTAAQHVIHFDRWWNPAVENQATDRAFRIGQKNNVLVHKFVCRGTIEEKIDQMIRDKSALAESVVERGGEINFSQFSDEDLIKLIQLDATNISEPQN